MEYTKTKLVCSEQSVVSFLMDLFN